MGNCCCKCCRRKVKEKPEHDKKEQNFTSISKTPDQKHVESGNFEDANSEKLDNASKYLQEVPSQNKSDLNEEENVQPTSDFELPCGPNQSEIPTRNDKPEIVEEFAQTNSEKSPTQRQFVEDSDDDASSESVYENAVDLESSPTEKHETELDSKDISLLVGKNKQNDDLDSQNQQIDAEIPDNSDNQAEPNNNGQINEPKTFKSEATIYPKNNNSKVVLPKIDVLPPESINKVIFVGDQQTNTENENDSDQTETKCNGHRKNVYIDKNVAQNNLSKNKPESNIHIENLPPEKIVSKNKIENKTAPLNLNVINVDTYDSMPEALPEQPHHTIEYADVTDIAIQMSPEVSSDSDSCDSDDESPESSPVQRSSFCDPPINGGNLQMKFVTKGLQIPVYVQTPVEEQIKHDRLLKEYVDALEEIKDWLDCKEKKVDEILALPVPLEPNALHEQVKLVDELLHEIEEGKKLLDTFNAASENLQTCPKFVYQHLEEKSTLPETQTEIADRYDALSAKSSSLSSKLHGTLEQSEDVSDQLENLQKLLKMIGEKISDSKNNATATSESVAKNMEILEDLNKQTDDIGGKVEDLQKKCVNLFGSANSEAGCSLKSTMANLVTLQASVSHEGQHFHKHLSEVEDDLRNFEKSCDDVTDVLDDARERTAGLGDEDECDGKSGDDLQEKIEATEENIKKLQEMRSEVLAKEPEYTNAVSVGEKLLVNCCFDTKPLASSIEDLKSKWKNAFGEIKSCEDDLVGSGKELARNQDAMCKVKEWVEQCGGDLAAMKDSVQQKVVSSDLETIKDHMEKAEPIRNDALCEKYLHVPFCISPSSDKTNTDDCICFTDLLEKSKSKQKDLQKIVEDLSDISSKSAAFCEVLDLEEQAKESWEKKFADVNLETLKADAESYRAWRDGVKLHAPDFESLQNTVKSFEKQNGKAEGMDEVVDAYENIESRWKKLLADCDDLGHQVSCKCDAQSQYLEKQDRLGEWLQDKRTIFSMLDVPCADPEAFEKQNKQIEKLSKDVASHEHNLDEAASLVEVLPQLSPMYEQLKEDWEKLKEDLQQLLSKRMNSNDKLKLMNDLLDDLSAWSKDVKDKIEETKLEADVEKFQDELDKIKKQRDDEVKENKGKLSDCANHAKDLAASGLISDNLQCDVTNKATNAFESAMKAIDNHENKVKEMLKDLESSIESCKDIVAWCKATSLELKSMDKSPSTLNQLDASLQRLEDYSDTGEKHLDNLEKTEECLRKLSEKCESGDQQFVKDAKEALDAVLDEIKNTKLTLKERRDDLEKFNELNAACDQKLESIKNRINLIQEMSGLTSKQIKYCQDVNADLADEGHAVVGVCDFAKRLTAATSPRLLSPATASGTCQLATADDEHLTVAANALAEKYQELKQALADLAANLDSVAKFEAEISDICDKLNLLETGFDEFDPVSRSEPTLLDQQRESTQLLDSFVALEQDATDLDRRYQEYAATAPDGASHERDIKTVARNARRLVEKCRKREAEVGDTLEQVRSFDVTSDELESDLVRMIGEMKAKDCKAANAERLKELQDELKEFRQECIYPARRRTNESTTSGYALIYSAHHSVPTHHILEKVKKIEHLWAQLSEQVASFDSELQNALISSGHYKDVYDSYLIWLRNVELLVARQQPLSWEYTVVAVQLEEHKALEEILHKEHEVLQTFLRQFSDYHSSPEDQNNIQDLKRRWEDVSDKVSKRSDELSAVTSEARLFHGLSTKFQAWLGKVEKRSMDLVFTGTLQDRITKEIQHQQALLKEISQHEGEMGEIESTPLRKLFTDNEEQSESLNNHLVVLRSRYEEAKRLVEGRHGVLLANQELAHIFNERLLSLFAFVVECKLRLSKWEDQEGNVRVLDAKPAHIKKASEACEAILDEVKRKQPMLETSVKQGRGLLSQCAGDDNLQAHEKLDNLSVEFNLLITRSTSIASKLASSMDDSDRLDDADRKLKSWFKDSNKLFYDLELKEEMDLEKWNEQAKSFELDEHEGLLDTVKHTAGSLQAISMWWGPQLLSKLWKLHKTQFAVVKDKFGALNKNYAEIQEQIEQFNDELNTGEELVDKFVDAIDRYEDISALDEETLKDKKQQQKEMDDLRSEVGAHSVKLEQTFHKLVCRIDRDTAKPLKASMDTYRVKMQDALKKHEHCLATSALALSLASKWHETNKSLLSWMEEANNELEAIKGEKCPKLETYKQKLQALLHKHAEERPLAENIVKLSSQIGKLLDPSSAAEELQATSVKNQDEYFEFGKKLEDLIKDVDKHGKELLELMQHLDEESKYASDLMEDLTHLPPVSLDEEPLLQRACVFEKLLSPGGEFTERLPSHQDEVDQIVQDLSDLGYEHLQQGVADKFVSLEELKSSLQDFSTDELEKLKALLDAIRNFSAKGEETTEKLSALSDSIESLSVPQVINPDILSQKTTEFETLTGDLLEAGEEVTCLTTLGEECKLSKVTSGVEPSSVDSSVQEATRELAKVQDLFEKKKMDFNSALEYAIHFHKTAAALKRKFAEQCAKIDRLPDDLNDVDAIKDEIEQLKAIRAESTPQQIEGKNLCAQAFDVIARSGVAVESQGEEVEQLQNASKLLDDKLQEKQVSLDNSLIDAGEMQHAMDELKDWMDETADKLAAQQESCEFCVNDSKKLELELTKLKVTSQDIAAHEPTYKSIAAATRDSDDLTRQWDGINATSAELKKTLEQYLESAQSKEAELFDIEGWIDDQQNFLNNSTFFGGLPETAQQQLDNHVAFMDELENKRKAMEKILEGPNMDGKDLREKMEKLKAQADTRKAKLEEVLAEAKAFHERLEKFVSWLGQAEKTLSGYQETKHSILYPAIKETLDEQKSFEEGVVAMRPEILELDKNGSRLKYFSQKQDGILIKNLLLSVHARWDKLVSATSARSANITDVHKKSKQFHDDYEKLRDWIATVHKQLESGQSDFYVDAPDSVENELDNFKEFQRALAAKQPVYEGVQRSGLLLCEKVLQQNDKHDVEAKLKQLKKEWNGVNQQSVKRKHQLEESLLVSGRFIEAIESLLQWLCKIEPGVESQENLNGDIHTVNALIDRHNILHNEFNARAANVESLQASVDGQGDSWVSHQLKELLERWNDVSDKISTKADKLEDALLKAKELHSSAQVVLDELSSIEKHLQSQPKFPDDEFQLEELKAAHQTVTNDLDATLERRDKVISLASEILKSSHPDAHTPLRQLITVLDTKCDEVKQMSDEYGANLDEALDKLKRDSDRLKKLENWLEEGEDNLRRKEAININEENIQRLKEEQEMFQEEMISHQPDYESLMNLYKRKHSPTKRKGDLKKSPRAGDSEGSPMESLCDNVHATWQRVWLMSLQHERKLQAAEESIRRNGQQDDFDFDDWRTRYMKYLKHKRARVMDFFRELDKDGSGQISRELFVNEILKSKFQTNEAEMSRVADVFDQDGDGFIDYYEFIAALYPSRDAYKPESDADKIDDEVVRQVSKCTCCKKFRVEQIAENKYKFGDNQQLRLVRILRSTVMVRVGGGWMALDEFLIKNDPCRAKGRTNTELREKFILPSGSSQAMTPFKTKRATRSPQKPSPTSSVASDLSSTTSDCSSLRHHHKMSHTSPAKLPSRNSTPVPPHSKRGETTPKRTSTPTHPTGAGRETPKRTPTPNRPNTTPGRTSKIPTKDRTPKR